MSPTSYGNTGAGYGGHGIPIPTNPRPITNRTSRPTTTITLREPTGGRPIGNRITPETHQDITTRYQAGETVPTIARTLGISADTVKRHLRAAGVTLRDDRRGQGATSTADRIASLGQTSRAIRKWARSNGYHVPQTGLIPGPIIDAYTTAQQEGPTP